MKRMKRMKRIKMKKKEEDEILHEEKDEDDVDDDDDDDDVVNPNPTPPNNNFQSSTIGAILSDVVKITNKLIQVLKIKNNDWKVSIVSNDLVDVMQKIKKQYQNITNVNEDGDLMEDYIEIYRLAHSRLSELKTLFIQLVKSSNSAGLVVGGSRGSNSVSLFYAE